MVLTGGATFGVPARGMTTERGGDFTRSGPVILNALSLGEMLILPSALGVTMGGDEGAVLLFESIPNVPRRGFFMAIGESGASGIAARARP